MSIRSSNLQVRVQQVSYKHKSIETKGCEVRDVGQRVLQTGFPSQGEGTSKKSIPCTDINSFNWLGISVVFRRYYQKCIGKFVSTIYLFVKERFLYFRKGVTKSCILGWRIIIYWYWNSILIYSRTWSTEMSIDSVFVNRITCSF